MNAPPRWRNVSSHGGALFGGVLFLAIIALVSLVMIASFWRIFTKAGEEGWKSLIPIYNAYVYATRVGGSSDVMFILALIFGIPWILIHIDVAESFGKSTLWGLGLSFLGVIFMPLLAFGSASYQG